jgi:hypothetical protein
LSNSDLPEGSSSEGAGLAGGGSTVSIKSVLLLRWIGMVGWPESREIPGQVKKNVGVAIPAGGETVLPMFLLTPQSGYAK